MLIFPHPGSLLDARRVLVDRHETAETAQNGYGVPPQILECVDKDILQTELAHIMIDHDREAKAFQKRTVSISKINIDILIKCRIPIQLFTRNAEHLRAMHRDVEAFQQSE